MPNPSRANPAAASLALSEAKSWLRVTHTADDALISELIDAARDTVEEHCCRTLVNRVCTYVLDADDIRGSKYIWMPFGPVVSITSATVYDTDGNTTLVTASDYFLDGDRLVNYTGWEYGRLWKSLSIVYVAGYGASHTSIPQGLRQVVRVCLADLYMSRQSEVAGTTVVRSAQTWQSLAAPYRQGHLTTWH